ncbi:MULTISPECIES: PIG-L family deacetylase [Streptomyces]|uniref:PIG-L family deacetylase n=1 Tax=Streptomyces TaxID=1883 RepID=UPI0031E47506
MTTSFAPRRRTVLAAMLALAAAGCTSKTQEQPKPVTVTPRAQVPVGDDGASGATSMQIVAHPDDDLYFMNPDVRQSIDANDKVVSVYVTSGEADGRNKVPGRKERLKPDFAGYAGARQQGLRQAYALMAAGDPHAEWKRGVLPLPGGLQAETDTLVSHPGVVLVFLGIAQHTADDKAGGGKDVRLPALWSDPKAVSKTRVAAGSTVQESHPIDRGAVIDALAAVLDHFRPTLVRTMDLDPDMQVHDARNRLHHDQAGYSDHPDHTAAALFTYAALQRYRGPGKGAHYTVTAYRGYYNERWPQNLPDAAVRRKVAVLNAYGGAPGSCDFPAGCGDYDVGQNRAYGTGWAQRTSYRYPGNATWVLPDADGRLTAFGVLDQQAALWHESSPGSGKWQGPKLLGGGPLLPGLTAGLTHDGRWQVFAERISGLGTGPDDNSRELVVAEQDRKNGDFGPWTSLGNPEDRAARGRRVGGPVVARNADGSAQLFARNWAKGVATRHQQPDGTWTPWTQLDGGAEVQEGLAAVTDTKGRIHVFGSGHDTVHHWVQRQPGGTFEHLPTKLPLPADPPAALARPDGSLLLVIREPKTATLLAYRLPAGATEWERLQLGLAARGFGPATLLPAGEHTLIAARNDNGSTSLALWRTGKTPRWTTQPGLAVGTAALATAKGKKHTVAWLGTDAKLHAAGVK